MCDELPGGIRVFVIDACRTTLWGLEKLIESTNGTMTLVGSATSAREVLGHVKNGAPDVILFSAMCADANPLESIPALLQIVDARILVLTPKLDLLLQEKAILAGARGVVDGEASPERVLLAITRIYQGEVWVNRASVTRILSECARHRSARPMDPEQRKIATLTGRERQIVAAFAAHPGATAKTIARLLSISEHTARNHLNSVYEKLQVANRVELFDYAHRHRLLELGEAIP